MDLLLSLLLHVLFIYRPMDNAKATNLFKKVQDNMRKKPKPVAQNENAGRGLKGDATSTMQNLIKPAFP